MNKILTAAAAAFFALTSLVGSSAEAFNLRVAAPAGVVHKAGGCGGGSYGRIYRSYRPRYSSVSRRVKAKSHVASKPKAKPVTVAKEEAETKIEAASTDAKVENSSISTGDGDVAAVKAPVADKKVAASNDPGCKKFFPSVGMTLSVPCE